ncbi:uncharacterized protein UHOD_00545 [Ustilago sp. UG-2017b]|nr:uncharacterized protein UHOD_00545 [Ustilago sp. UG-2017b]
MGLMGQAGLSTLREEETLIRFDHVPSYSEFFDRCLLPNRPCILPPALISQWNVVKSQAWHRKPSSSRVSSSSDKGDDLVNWEALAQDYGSHTSPVVVIHINAEGKTIEERTEMTIASAIGLIQKNKLKQDKDGVQSIYIKDWHLIKQLRSQPTADEPYSVPNLFADDWMNNIHPSGTAGEVDDFRFVYAGTAGSQTLLHRDVYTSYSWSTNVVGRKKWHIFPPRAIPHLRRFPAVETSQLVSDIQTLQTLMKDSNRKDYPQLERAWELLQGIDQEEGETIFIPSNWYHQVSNVTEAISINRNWCNSINLPSLYEAIKRELEHVEESLCDVRDMLSDSSGGKDGDEWKREFYVLVQDVAVKDAGWAWKGVWDMVVRNLEHPATKQDLRPKDGWVKERLLPLVKDFELREDGKWLDGEGIQNTTQRCKGLLEDMR